MQPDEVLAILRETGVIREGHFLLTSGMHSDRFLLLAQVLQYPRHAERLCREMAEPFREAGVEVVVGPAVGGIILAYEVARALGARAIFAEKVEGGGMALRRGFQLRPGERVLVVEDAISTGGSVRKVLDAIAPFGPEVVGVSALVDRTGGQVDFGVPTRAVLTLSVPAWPPEACPLCRAGVELVRPKG
ncbi:MAG: orotate phosphoribosyltransferase [Firmicutes bacterium]|nr:orotate phosphoribosyltransferase [Bacillota bacterium]